MIRRPSTSTRTDTLFPCTTRFRSRELFAQRRGGAEAERAIGNARREPAVEVEFFIVFPRRRESRVACVTLLTLGSRFRGSTGLSGTANAPSLRATLLPEHAAPVEQRDGDAAVARIGGVGGAPRLAHGDAFHPPDAQHGRAACR